MAFKPFAEIGMRSPRGANNSSPGPAGHTCSDAIIASGENDQIPVALKVCSQLLIGACFNETSE
jgi:hypothetical protein